MNPFNNTYWSVSIPQISLGSISASHNLVLKELTVSWQQNKCQFSIPSCHLWVVAVCSFLVKPVIPRCPGSPCPSGQCSVVLCEFQRHLNVRVSMSVYYLYQEDFEVIQAFMLLETETLTQQIREEAMYTISLPISIGLVCFIHLVTFSIISFLYNEIAKI